MTASRRALAVAAVASYTLGVATDVAIFAYVWIVCYVLFGLLGLDQRR